MTTFRTDFSALPPSLQVLATDVGPVIDREAFDNIQNHLRRLNSASKVLSAHKGRE